MSQYLKRVVYLFIFIPSIIPLMAQNSTPTIMVPELNISHNSQRMFEEALKEVVFCMRQEYVIQNKRGEKFGRSEKAYFGNIYTIGVLVGSDLSFPSYLRKPWTGDKNLNEYKKTHKPVCSNLYIRNVNGGLERELTNLQIDTTYAISSFKQGQGGLRISLFEDKSKGYLMLYHVPLDTDEKFPEITITLHLLENLDWDSKGTAEVKNYNFMGKEAIGGILLMEHITTGIIELRIGGLYLKKGEKWILNRITAQNKS